VISSSRIGSEKKSWIWSVFIRMSPGCSCGS